MKARAMAKALVLPLRKTKPCLVLVCEWPRAGYLGKKGGFISFAKTKEKEKNLFQHFCTSRIFDDVTVFML